MSYAARSGRSDASPVEDGFRFYRGTQIYIMCRAGGRGLGGWLHGAEPRGHIIRAAGKGVIQ